jgi:hypothetical protein
MVKASAALHYNYYVRPTVFNQLEKALGEDLYSQFCSLNPESRNTIRPSDILNV